MNMKKLLTHWNGLLAAVFILFLGITQAALAADPLVDTAWVKANIGKSDVAFVDLQPATGYLRGHIPGAVNSDFGKSGWREERAADKVPDMLPTNLDKLVAHIGSLGIDNNTHVVLVAPGDAYLDMGWATRIYWTFKVLGHDNVSILNGGMNDWAKNKANPMQTGMTKAEPKTFTAHLDKSLIATVEDVKAAKAKGVMLIDSRPEDQYVGINRNPKATENGTLPGAKNLPSGWTTENGGGKFRSTATLKQLYKVAGVPVSGEQITFCNTGHLASIGWFVSSELVGNKKTKLYDGSMVEWTMDKAGPVEQKVKLQ
jgi:thiosulfate/3-mercaptopyruvate sulfurtransferase